jgi:uncharacterized membrane protein YdjX (TVP38/TMEM64 family)
MGFYRKSANTGGFPPQSNFDGTKCQNRSEGRRLKIGAGLLFLVVLLGAYWFLSDKGHLSMITSEARLQDEVSQLGPWGPITVIGFMALAIVMSPIPSGPIGMAAGAAFGPVLGAVYVIGGSVLGAVVAFGLARMLGYEFVRGKLGSRFASLQKTQSQNKLMGIIFLTRLIPFISFDAVSYVAGVTPIRFWRFGLATLFGVIPISFVITYLGNKVLMLDTKWSLIITGAVAVATGLPLIVAAIRNRSKRRHV